MNIFEKTFFDSAQYVRYNPQRKFYAERRIFGISAIFQILPTQSCCYSVKGLSLELGGSCTLSIYLYSIFVIVLDLCCIRCVECVY
jgi:hypothetical protein